MGSKTRAGFDVYPPSETPSGAAAPRGGDVYPPRERESHPTQLREFSRDSRESEKERFKEVLCPSGSAGSQAERPCRAANNLLISLRDR